MDQVSHISKLYLFSKNTDAVESIRGYKFQELKALEIWLYNKLNNINERIYLDYEEDLFQRNLDEFTTTFTQLKLYSQRNFSFSSIEIKKAISHFFTLFVKGEYIFEKPLFVFETNTEVANSYPDNDAELLKKWAEASSPISGELLSECVAKLKRIIGGYISERYAVLSHGETPADELIWAKNIYDSLPNETWEEFTKSIRWKFTGDSPEKTIEKLIFSCRELIKALPFPISEEECPIVFDKLRGIISDTIINPDASERYIDVGKLNHALQFLGDDEDRDYNKSFENWKEVKEIGMFKFGDFYNVLFSSKHCRRRNNLEIHTDLWKSLLNQYLSLKLPDLCRQEAIYELVWLMIRPKFGTMPSSNISELDDLLREYFSKIQEYSQPRMLEDILSLLSIVGTCSKVELTKIPYEEIEDYVQNLEKHLNDLISSANDVNYKCSYFEELSFLILNRNIWRHNEDIFSEPINKLEQIFPLLPLAKTFSLSQLARRIDAMINLLNETGKSTESLEKYYDDILPFVKEREGEFSFARVQINRGITCLKKNDIYNISKALDYFHKAKSLYLTNETFEGFILALMNISQLYSGIGLQFAAKYYSYAAIWYSSHNGNPILLRRISDSYGLVYHYDFISGAWMSALVSFNLFMAKRAELVSSELDENNEIEMKSFTELAFILMLAPKYSDQIAHYIEYEIKEMGEFYTEIIEPVVKECDSKFGSKGIDHLLDRRLDHEPINDLGAIRVLEWQFLECKWIFEFQNNYFGNSVGEEFCALVQIIQSEIIISSIDLQIIPSSIKINIIIGESEPPKETASKSNVWNLYIPIIDDLNPSKILIHYKEITSAFWTILTFQTALSNEEALKIFNKIFTERIHERALIANSYQNIYRTLISEEKFNISRRNNFEAVSIKIPLRKHW